jgi:hypothetical protein
MEYSENITVISSQEYLTNPKYSFKKLEYFNLCKDYSINLKDIMSYRFGRNRIILQYQPLKKYCRFKALELVQFSEGLMTVFKMA